ncbi:MAG: polyribonucleotide nucleotidyltransferase, partial [Flavobacteriales bacterium]|nr:polyribonucleotide nucleotidyltransferase [Flavobacteriales bacterium]
MKPTGIQKTITLSDGRTISLETGILAKQADGAVTVRLGDTILLATVVASKEAREGIDFLPLQVEYREKFSAAGRFPGGFFKRENRPHDGEILVSRLVDRALRPLFNDDFHGDTQVQISMMSSDKVNPADALACLAASAAIAVSDIPFSGPVSEVRVIRKGGSWTINPTYAQMEGADIDLIVAGTAKDILMVEGEMQEVTEAEMIEGIKLAHDSIKDQCRVIEALAAEVPKSLTKRTYNHEENDAELEKAIVDGTFQKYYDITLQASAKEVRGEA